MATLNQCQFIGRVGKQPEVRYTQAGDAVASFSLAVSEKHNGQEKTEWVNLTAWKKTAEIVKEYVGKGDMLYISGRMQTRKWTDKDGNDRYATEVVVDRLQMLSGRKDKSGAQDAGTTGADTAGYEDDIPF